MALGTAKNFGNNLKLESFDYRIAGKFTDENRLLNMLSGDESSQRMHLGMLSLFNQMQVINTPLLKETELQGNQIMLNGDDGEFTFDVPYTLELPTIKADLTGTNPLVGVDGQAFEVVIGDGNLEPIFSVNHIIACDLRDGQNFEVVQVGDKYGEGFVYKLRLITFDKTEAVDKRQLAPGTQYMVVGSTIGKYDEHGAGITMSAGKMRFLHKLGGKRAVEMSIHGSAQRFKLEGIKGMGGDANAFAATVAPFLDPKNPDFLKMIGYNDGTGKMDFSRGVSVVSMYEILLYAELQKQRQFQMTWGQGGQLQDQRNTTKLVAQGLYQQMKAGNWIKVPKYTKDTLISVLSQVFKNRPDIPDTERYIHFQGGRGAVLELSRIFAQEGAYIANAIGTVLDNSSLKIVTGTDAYHLKAGYRFTEVFFPGFGHVTIEHNIAFDANFNRYMDEEMIGGLPKYSYTCAVFDVTKSESTNAFKATGDVQFANGFNNQSNVYMLKNAGLPGIKVSYANGRTSPYPINMGKGQIVSTMFDGVKILMEEQSEVWLKDPGRSVLLQLK